MPLLWRQLFVLSRPSGALLVPLIPLLSLYFAHWDRALRFEKWGECVVLALTWLLLHCGTMWLNAALDQDEGPVLFGDVCPVPRYAVRYGYGALGVSVALSFLLGPVPLVLTSICAILAVLYSYPVDPWKGVSVLGPLVNIMGYGVCSPLSGWWVADVSVNLRTLLVFSVIPPFVMACYLVAQSFQGYEDRIRGYRTLVVTHGARYVLDLATVCFHFVFLQFLVLSALGWLPRELLALSIPYVLLVRFMSRWKAHPYQDASEKARAVMRQLSAAAIVVLVGLMGHQLASLASHGPSAGLATAAGLPVDRMDVRDKAIQRMQRKHASTLVTHQY